MATRYCIIGASAAGMSAARTLITLSPDVEVVIFEAKERIPLNKCFFVDVISGAKQLSEINILPVTQRTLVQPHIRTGSKVVAIDAPRKLIRLADGIAYAYDALLLACGTRAHVPPLFEPYIGNGLVFTIHNSCDVCLLLGSFPSLSGKSAVVVGSGLTGLELADALHQAGVLVTLLEHADQLFSSMQCGKVSEVIASQAAVSGVQTVCKSTIAHLEQREQSMALTTNSGDVLHADVLFVCTGQRPVSELIIQAGLRTFHGGVLVNEHLQTSEPYIYAAGDIAVVSHALSGEKQLNVTWPDAMHQGMLAARAMLGKDVTYAGVVPAIHSYFFGYEYAALDAHLLMSGELELCIGQSSKGITILGHTDGLLRAYAHYGKASVHALLRRAVLTGISIVDVSAEVLP